MKKKKEGEEVINNFNSKTNKKTLLLNLSKRRDILKRSVEKETNTLTYNSEVLELEELNPSSEENHF